MQLHPSLTDPDVAPDTRPAAAHSASPLRRRLLWTGGVLVVLLLLVFVPPLVNVNRYRRQIANTMSASLGRPVHLDNISMHLLPVPGFTLSNFVVSEDPAFGDEPTLRADSVEATLRLVSLWRHPVEFSTVRFIEPHVNLVRNRQGRWNLADVLLHASHIQTAPTAQMHAGPAPRFPYIEATGGRVNVKMGSEKLPFSITDADFALWLPSPNQWRLRLKGEPARTDTNLNDPGTLRVEGGLQRAETATGIPVEFHATWHNAPLGEASRLLTGDDLGWRGTLNWDATLSGTLSEARLRTQVTLGEVRRAEFAAQQPLDLQVTCGAQLAAAKASMLGLRCEMPDSAPTPMLLQADSVNLEQPAGTAATLVGEAIPLHWGMLWAALFSARVPTTLHPAGAITVHLQHEQLSQASSPIVTIASRKRGRSASATYPAAWTGEVRVDLPPASGLNVRGEQEAGNAAATTLVWRPAPTIVPSRTGQQAEAGLTFAMQPVLIPLGPGASVQVNATLGAMGYTVAVNGNANAADLLLPAKYLPQLGDGLDDILPYPPTSLDPTKVQFDCEHPWGQLQTCTSQRPSTARSRAGDQDMGRLTLGVQQAPQPSMPSLLTPHSLSPYDHQTAPGMNSEPRSPSTPVLPHL